jgi:hypothetical protein
MLDTWRQLSPQEQQALRQDRQRCGEILREKQQGNHPDELAKLQHIASVE